MLVWLDGNENRAGQPNENFARELLELFALGIGNYTEDDVREAARAFTGWGTLGRSFHHRPEHHDGGEKVIFGRRGPFDGEAALELVLEHPACPHWIARRLLAAFVTQSPSDGQIDEVAAALLEEHWQVGATLRRLLASRLFFAPEQRRARIAAPVELVARSARITGARLAPAEAARAAARMGQALFRPPSVKGWSGAHAWIDAGTWIARHNLLVGLACDPDGPGGLAAALGNPSEPRDVPAAALGALFAGAGDERLVRTLEGEAARAPDTGAALCSVAALLMTAPEYHLT
jgi:uncharacterized protein (DUF1800 family)